jgi:hypothetical protein
LDHPIATQAATPTPLIIAVTDHGGQQRYLNYYFSPASSCKSSWTVRSILAKTSVASLPVEVLEKILFNMSRSTPFHLRSALFVCRAWYLAIQNYSKLWSCIVFDQTVYTLLVRHSVQNQDGRPDGEIYSPDLTLICSFFKACLRNSRATPLKVLLDIKSFEDVDYSITSEEMDEMIRLLVGEDMEHIKRWHHFMWFHSKYVMGAMVVFDSFPTFFPGLQRLALHGLDTTIGSRQFPNCPNLKVLMLSYHVEEGQCKDSMIIRTHNCCSIRKLIIREHVWDSRVIRRISFCLKVRTLILCGNCVNPYDDDDGVPPIHLPNLRRLELFGYVPIEILTSIVPNANMVVKMEEMKESEEYLDSVTTLKGTPLAAEMGRLYLGWSDRAVDRVDLEDFQALLDTAESLQEIQWSQYANSRLLAAAEASSVSRRADFSITVSA